MHSTLVPGQKVPDLSVALAGGGQFTLNEKAPENFTIVIFYRGIHCPICKGQLNDFRSKLPDFEALGIDVVALSMNTQELAEQTMTDWDLSGLKLGYGLTKSQARAWGLYMSAAIKDTEPDEFSEPGLAIVRPDGTLYHWSLQTAPFGRAKAAELASVLKYVIDNNYPVRGTLVA
ncbi:MAG: peroxiredoxin-like family protein [Anderseniella sp.]